MLLQFPQERLDVLLILRIVRVNGAVADNVGRRGDIAAYRSLVLETESYSIEIRGDTGQV